MRTQQTFEEFKEETRRDGALKARRQDVLECLEVRELDLTPEFRERIESCDDAEQLSRWHRRAITAETVDAVFDGE